MSRPPVSRPLRRIVRAALALALALTGCSEEPEVLPSGRYAYQAAHPTPGGDTIRLEGVLEITHDTVAPVAGTWDVPQLHPEVELAETEDGGVLLTAHPTYFGTITHRVAGSGGRLACEGEYTWVAEGGVQRSLPVRCSISPEVPPGVTPGLPTPDRPIVRPVDPDSVPLR